MFFHLGPSAPGAPCVMIDDAVDRRFPPVTTFLARQRDMGVTTLGDNGVVNSAEIDHVGPLKRFGFLQDSFQCIWDPVSTVRTSMTTINDTVDRRSPLVTTFLACQRDMRVYTLGDMGFGDLAEIDGVGLLELFDLLQKPFQCVWDMSSTVWTPFITINNAIDRRFPLVLALIARQRDFGIVTFSNMGFGNSAEIDRVCSLKRMCFLQESFQCIRDPSSTVRTPMTTMNNTTDCWSPMVGARLARQWDV